MPAVFAVACLVVLALAAVAGQYLRRIGPALEEDERADLSVVLTAGLTLLGLIIGFTFSLAVTRYNQRKDCEAAEANAIGTEYFRASLLPASDCAQIRELLKMYMQERILFYTTRNEDRLRHVNTATMTLQNDLWSAVTDSSLARPTPIAALAVAGMNDVFNSEGYTQAAWWNRIPAMAWILMLAISIYCEYLVGYTARHYIGRTKRRLALPIIVSITFFLIAEIDSPNGGLIRVHPQNLERLAWSIRG